MTMDKIKHINFEGKQNVTIYLGYDVDVHNALASLVGANKSLGGVSNPYFLVWGITILKYIDLFDQPARDEVINALVEEFQFRFGSKIRTLDDIVNIYKNLEGLVSDDKVEEKIKPIDL